MNAPCHLDSFSATASDALLGLTLIPTSALCTPSRARCCMLLASQTTISPGFTASPKVIFTRRLAPQFPTHRSPHAQIPSFLPPARSNAQRFSRHTADRRVPKPLVIDQQGAIGLAYAGGNQVSSTSSVRRLDFVANSLLQPLP
ncbi:hypothetical protein BV20DRAFT_428391 [Pilatotrama ljubarskyi]|nr:hypothetical protein BV20DRAFT_428391 [Pilatotrama ljubarskyi]